MSFPTPLLHKSHLIFAPASLGCAFLSRCPSSTGASLSISFPMLRPALPFRRCAMPLKSRAARVTVHPIKSNPRLLMSPPCPSVASPSRSRSCLYPNRFYAMPDPCRSKPIRANPSLVLSMLGRLSSEQSCSKSNRFFASPFRIEANLCKSTSKRVSSIPLANRVHARHLPFRSTRSSRHPAIPSRIGAAPFRFTSSTAFRIRFFAPLNKSLLIQIAAAPIQLQSSQIRIFATQLPLNSRPFQIAADQINSHFWSYCVTAATGCSPSSA